MLLTVHKCVYSSCSLCHWRGCLRYPAQCYIFMRSRPTTWKERKWVCIIYPGCIFVRGIHSSTFHLRWSSEYFVFPLDSVSFTYVSCWIGERTFLHLTGFTVSFILVFHQPMLVTFLHLTGFTMSLVFHQPMLVTFLHLTGLMCHSYWIPCRLCISQFYFWLALLHHSYWFSTPDYVSQSPALSWRWASLV